MKTSFTASAAAAGEDKGSPTSRVGSRADRGAATLSPAPLAAWPLRGVGYTPHYSFTPPQYYAPRVFLGGRGGRGRSGRGGRGGRGARIPKNDTEKSRKRSAKPHHTILRRFRYELKTTFSFFFVRYVVCIFIFGETVPCVNNIVSRKKNPKM